MYWFVEKSSGNLVVDGVSFALPKYGAPCCVCAHNGLVAVYCTGVESRIPPTIVFIDQVLMTITRQIPMPFGNQTPDDMKFGPEGRSMFVSVDARIYELTLDGVARNVTGNNLLRLGHVSLDFDYQWHMLVSDMSSANVFVHDRFGEKIDHIGAYFDRPIGVLAHGNDIHVLDTGASRIYMFDKV
jgi:hypothetical protein